MQVSLIVTTYNNVDYLRAVLTSIQRLRVKPAEVVVADDGSTDSTRELIDGFRQVLGVPLLHVWQQDLGFRAAEIRNKAVAASSGDYIVQIDGDIIVDANFIADHIKIAREGYVVCGSRVILDEKKSAKIARSLRSPRALDASSGSFMNGLRIPLLSEYVTRRYKSRGSIVKMRGCNMAYWRKDFMAINGYNEDMTGWGYEDNELAIRFMNSGLRICYLKLSGVVYHLFHKIRSREGVNRNLEILNDAIASKTVRCASGVDSK